MADKSLEEFVESVNGTSHLRVEHDFGDGFVRLRASEAERRQAAQDIRCSEDIVLELLRNARDAHAANIFLAMSRESDKRIITVIDDGQGIPSTMHEHVFEPRVTSKLDTSHMDAWGLHGRGMALYSISVNAEKAYIASSDISLGCSVYVETDAKKLAERADQSSFPTFLVSEGNKVAVRGPRNILRTACEFAIEARSSCSVYVGSPVDIAATLFHYSVSTLSSIDRAFSKDPCKLPLSKRLATSADPEMFRDISHSMGLDLSERTARRIMNGEIAALDPILDLVELVKDDEVKSRPARAKKPKRKAMRLAHSDVEDLKSGARLLFSEIAQRYYLEEDIEPSVRTGSDRLTISIPLVRKE